MKSIFVFPLVLLAPAGAIAQNNIPVPLSTGFPTLDWNFVLGALPGNISFTRSEASANATYFNSSGVLTAAATNAPRFDYNPSTLAPMGLLMEQSSTNGIRNNTMVGAVVSGALPTNWSTDTTASLTPTVAALGTENGVNYIDLAFSGTAAAGYTDVYFDTATGIAGLTAQNWSEAVFLKQSAGSQTNVSSVTEIILENTNTGTNVSKHTVLTPTVTTAGLATQRSQGAVTTSGGATVAAIQPSIRVNFTAGAVSFTLRIGMPQLEQLDFSTSTIATSGSTVTRLFDMAYAAQPFSSSIYSQAKGTFVVNFMMESLNLGYTGRIVQCNDASTNNTLEADVTTGTGNVLLEAINGGAATSFTSGFNVTAGAVSAVAYSYTHYMASANAQITGGGLTATNGSVTLSPINNSVIIELGDSNRAGTRMMNGWFRRLRYWPRIFPLAQLSSMTTAGVQ